jgi:leucyl aminopeptidase
MQIDYLEFDSTGPSTAQGAALAVFAQEETPLSGAAERLDQMLGGALTRATKAGRFKGAKGQTLDLLAPTGVEYARVLLIGVGKTMDEAAVEQAAANAYLAVKTSGLETLVLDLSDATAEQAARAGLGVRLAAYRFDKYRTREKAESKPSVTTAQIVTKTVDAARAADPALAALAEAVSFTRDLVSEPPNVLYPAEFAQRMKALERLGLEVEILDEAKMAELGMGSLLCVGEGSARDSYLAVVQWRGAADPNEQPIAFVGKGVCFDSGGLSLKPADGMEDMKWDMGGAGAVAGLMHVLAGRKAKVNVVGILGLVENMPDGAALRPGDIVTSMSGQTIEVLNTDAEGRLVLADALWYCQDRFNPKVMIDLATLTGAIVVALGNDYAGLYSNDDSLSEALLAASKIEGEQLWRMPLPAAYEKHLETPSADMKNIGIRPGGSITAALFLQKFVNETPWAHLDIAAVAWRKSSTNPTVPDGASGFGVRLLNTLVANSFEG